MRAIREELDLPEHGAAGLAGRGRQHGNLRLLGLFAGDGANQLLACIGRVNEHAAFDLDKALAGELLAGFHQFAQRDAQIALLQVSPETLIRQAEPRAAVRLDARKCCQDFAVDIGQPNVMPRNGVDATAPATKNLNMSIETKPTVDADMEALLERIAHGTPLPPDVYQRIRDRSDRLREEMRQKFGTAEIAVDLVREIRDEE